jgi:quercetin dioxygenase-like cupin family protein
MKAIRGMAGAALLASSGLAFMQCMHSSSRDSTEPMSCSTISACPAARVVQVRVDFVPGTVSRRHSHPGEEIAYVLEGTLQYEVEGKVP